MPIAPASAPQAQPQIIYVQQQAPATPAPQPTSAPQVQVVVTPTYSGCHDGANYVAGDPQGGTCSQGMYAPEPTVATIGATAHPPDAGYLETIRNQAPHCIRCAP